MIHHQRLRPHESPDDYPWKISDADLIANKQKVGSFHDGIMVYFKYNDFANAQCFCLDIYMYGSFSIRIEIKALMKHCRQIAFFKTNIYQIGFLFCLNVFAITFIILYLRMQ